MSKTENIISSAILTLALLLAMFGVGYIIATLDAEFVPVWFGGVFFAVLILAGYGLISMFRDIYNMDDPQSNAKEEK